MLSGINGRDHRFDRVTEGSRLSILAMTCWEYRGGEREKRCPEIGDVRRFQYQRTPDLRTREKGRLET